MRPAFEVRSARVAYGVHVALDDVDLVVHPGERVALVGPSGAGKTTFLRLLTASLAPSAGEVEVLGCRFADASERELRRVRARIGVVSQSLDLVGPLRVVHNVNAGRLGRWSTARALASLVRPADREAAHAALLRVGIGEKLLERTDCLSHGEQQRVALARVLSQSPELLLADEPVASLDPRRAEDVVALLCEHVVDEPAALVVALHDFELARSYFDRLVGIRHGAVLFDLPASVVTDGMGEALYCIDP